MGRTRTHCPPWVSGRRFGWQVPSPVDVTIQALGDVQFASDPQSIQSDAMIHGAKEVWQREKNLWLGTANGSWMQRFDYRWEGSWLAMFVPNGEGTVEWRLGWAITLPKGYLLAVIGDEESPLSVPFGLLTPSQVETMNDRGGLSLPFFARDARLQRGDTIARIFPVRRADLNLEVRMAPYVEHSDDN